VQVHPAGKITVLARLDPRSTTLKPGFTRDVGTIGRYGTGDLEIVLTSPSDFEEAKPLLTKSYDLS
jgi:predicted transport protein